MQSDATIGTALERLIDDFLFWTENGELCKYGKQRVEEARQEFEVIVGREIAARVIERLQLQEIARLKSDLRKEVLAREARSFIEADLSALITALKDVLHAIEYGDSKDRGTAVDQAHKILARVKTT